MINRNKISVLKTMLILIMIRHFLLLKNLVGNILTRNLEKFFLSVEVNWRNYLILYMVKKHTTYTFAIKRLNYHTKHKPLLIVSNDKI